jgi:hypothetical protein
MAPQWCQGDGQMEPESHRKDTEKTFEKKQFPAGYIALKE